MAGKKNFLDSNPALQYISQLDADAPHSNATPDVATAKADSAPARSPIPDKAVSMPENSPEYAESVIPAGYKLDSHLVETKSRRLNLLMQPSLYARIQRAASARGVSINELIHSTLSKHLEDK